MLKDVNIGIEEEIGILITLFQLGGIMDKLGREISI